MGPLAALLCQDWCAYVGAVASVVSALAAVGSLVVAGLACWFGYRQIKLAGEQIVKLVESIDVGASSNRLEALARSLDVEREVSDRRFRVDAVEASIKRAWTAKRPDQGKVDFLITRRSLLVDSYFRSLDRLAYCILGGQLQEKDWKDQYHEAILIDRQSYADCFSDQSIDAFIHLKALVEHWSRPNEGWPVSAGAAAERPPGP